MVTYSPFWSPPLIVVSQQWGVGSLATALSSSWQMSLFMNILCAARPWCCTCSFDLHFKRKFCLYHCQRLFVTQCICCCNLFVRAQQQKSNSELIRVCNPKLSVCVNKDLFSDDAYVNTFLVWPQNGSLIHLGLWRTTFWKFESNND